MSDMIDLPDVDSLMADGLSDWLMQQHAGRAEAQRKIWRIGVASVVLGAVLALSGYFIGGAGVAYFIGAVMAMIGLGWTAHIRQKMVNSLKQEMNGALARSLAIEYKIKLARSQARNLTERMNLICCRLMTIPIFRTRRPARSAVLISCCTRQS